MSTFMYSFDTLRGSPKGHHLPDYFIIDDMIAPQWLDVNYYAVPSEGEVTFTRDLHLALLGRSDINKVFYLARLLTTLPNVPSNHGTIVRQILEELQDGRFQFKYINSKPYSESFPVHRGRSLTSPSPFSSQQGYISAEALCKPGIKKTKSRAPKHSYPGRATSAFSFL